MAAACGTEDGGQECPFVGFTARDLQLEEDRAPWYLGCSSVVLFPEETPTELCLVELDLDLAWSRLLEDRRDDFFPDPLDHRDFRHRLQDQLARIRFALERGQYLPREAIPYDVPKAGFFLRPASYLSTRDRVVYQALIDFMAADIDRSLSPPDIVFSFRLGARDEPSRMFRPPVPRWLQFRSEIRKAYYEEGYQFLINTDITGYFESIEHARLHDLLVTFGVVKDAPAMLVTLLSCWSPSGRGLPQGTDPSSMLGNCYLDPLDKHMLRADIRFFRYSDDMCIFGRTEAQVRRAQQLLERELRALGLLIQTKKTVLFEGDKIRAFVDERQDEIAGIDYAEFAGDITGTLQQTKALLDDLLADDESFDDRHFRKCINTLIKHRDDYAVDAVIERLDRMPHAANRLGEYLRLFAGRPCVQQAITEFIRDSERNLFEWQEAWLLRALLGANELSDAGLDWARRRAQDQASSWPLRCTAIQILEQFGDAADIQMLANNFRATEEPPVQRARLKACAGLPTNTRKSILRRAANVSDELAATVEYLGGTQ